MKAKDLSIILSHVQDLLALYKDDDVISILNDLKELKVASLARNTSDSKSQKIDERQLKFNIDQMIEELDSLSLLKIEEMLTSESLFPTMEFIRYFAKKVGIEITQRQSRINAIHSIIKHMDRMRINRTISKRID